MAQNEKETQLARKHNFSIEDRSRARLTGVIKVINVNSQCIMLVTTRGDLTITGSDLKVERFDVADGTCDFTGKLSALKYADAKTSLLKRIFK